MKCIAMYVFSVKAVVSLLCVRLSPQRKVNQKCNHETVSLTSHISCEPSKFFMAGFAGIKEKKLAVKLELLSNFDCEM